MDPEGTKGDLALTDGGFAAFFLKEVMKNSTTPEIAKAHEPWDKGKLIGQKAPLKPKDIWAIRVRLQIERRAKDLALFNLGFGRNLMGLQSWASALIDVLTCFDAIKGDQNGGVSCGRADHSEWGNASACALPHQSPKLHMWHAAPPSEWKLSRAVSLFACAASQSCRLRRSLRRSTLSSTVERRWPVVG